MVVAFSSSPSILMPILQASISSSREDNSICISNLPNEYSLKSLFIFLNRPSLNLTVIALIYEFLKPFHCTGGIPEYSRWNPGPAYR